MTETPPRRPVLAVSAAIFRDGKLLLVRRAQAPAHGLFTLPGGGWNGARRCIRPCCAKSARKPRWNLIGLAGYREMVLRDAAGAISGHFVILPFAARWIAGEVRLNEELSEYRWIDPEAVAKFPTTEGLPEIVTEARRLAGL